MPSRTGSGKVASTYRPPKKKRTAPASQGHPSQGAPTVGGGTKSKPTRYKTPPARTGSPLEQAADVALDTAQKHPNRKVRKAVKKGRKQGRALNRRAERVQRSLRGSKAARSKLTYEQRQALLAPPKKDTDTMVGLGPLGHLNIEAELEGRGKLAKAGKFVGDKLASEAGPALRRQGVGLPPSLDKYVGRAAKDAADLPAQSIASAYAVGAGAKEAAQGRPRRLKELGKQLKEHDPVALAAQGKFKKAAQAASAHPLATGLEVTGLGKGLSRLPNRIVKPKVRIRSVQGTAIRQVDRSPEGVVGRTVRGQVEKRKVKKARKLYRKADEAQKQGESATAVQELRRRAALKDPRRVSEREIRKRYDQREALAESRRRVHRGEAMKKADKALDKDAEAQLLVAQRVIKPTKESVRQYREQVAREAPSKELTPARAATNKRLQKKLTKIEKQDLSKVEASAEAYGKVVRPLQKELVQRGILDVRQERMAKLIPYAVQEMKATWSPGKRGESGQLEINGRKLEADQIEAHMRSQGIDPESVAFVSQHPRTKGARNYYISWQTPKGIMGGRRTGEAVRRGTFDVGKETGRENVARMQGLIDAHNEYSEFVKEFGYRGGGKTIRRFPTKKAAEEYIENLQAKPVEQGGNLTAAAHDWRAVPTRPPFGKKDQGEALLDQADTDVEGLPVRDKVGKALEGEGDGKYVLVLDSAADQMQKHLRVLDPTSGGKALRLVNRQFSSAVLSTNPAWVAGNAIEATVRSAVRGAGPVDRAFAGAVTKRLKQLDPKMAEELELRIGAGQAGMLELQMIHTAAEQFRGTAFEKLALRMAQARRAPGPKQAADLWKAYTHTVFGKNGTLEAQFKKAMLGQYAKQFLMDKNTLVNWDKAVDQAARGLRNTNEQVAAADWVRRAYGQYEAWGPTGRKLIANYTPFVAWTINAGRFLSQVLPNDHPVQTALIIGAYNATEEWRTSQNQGRGAPGAVPAWLQGSIPVKDKWLRLNRFTPFGFASDPLGTAGGNVVPQISGALMATKGLDWKGSPLFGHTRPDDVTDNEKVKGLLSSLAGAFVPGLNQAQNIKKHGIEGLSPFRGIERQDPKVGRAFDEIKQIEAKKDGFKNRLLNGEKISASNPTPEYARLHARERALNERIFKLTKGKYGHKYKEPYKPSGSSGGSSSSGSGWDQYRSGSAPKAKSGWDAYR